MLKTYIIKMEERVLGYAQSHVNVDGGRERERERERKRDSRV